jgi:hypothetical protein
MSSLINLEKRDIFASPRNSVVSAQGNYEMETLDITVLAQSQSANKLNYSATFHLCVVGRPN